MPSAVANVYETERKDLKSLPGGFVELRRMTYGQIVERRELMKMSIEASGKSKDVKGELAMASQAINLYEFRHCIVDHNLEDDNGTKLNLGSVVDFMRLDPRVGQEIEKFIGEMNNINEDDEELGN